MLNAKPNSGINMTMAINMAAPVAISDSTGAMAVSPATELIAEAHSTLRFLEMCGLLLSGVEFINLGKTTPPEKAWGHIDLLSYNEAAPARPVRSWFLSP